MRQIWGNINLLHCDGNLRLLNVDIYCIDLMYRHLRYFFISNTKSKLLLKPGKDWSTFLMY